MKFIYDIIRFNISSTGSIGNSLSNNKSQVEVLELTVEKEEDLIVASKDLEKLNTNTDYIVFFSCGNITTEKK